MKNAMILVLFCLLISPIARGETSDDPEGWQFLPRSRAFPDLPSDPLELRLGLHRNNKSEIEALVGGYRSLVKWWGGDTHFFAGLEGGGFFQMRQEGSKFPLQSSDGTIGLYAEADRGPWAGQVRYTHVSAHLSDGITATRRAILYTREFLQLRVFRQNDIWHFYGGVQALTHTAPDLPRVSFQLGSYGILPAHWGYAHPYFGGDIKIRGAAEGTTFQLGTGAAFASEHGAAPVFLTVNYLKGHDLRGQFFDEKTEKWIFGLDLEI